MIYFVVMGSKIMKPILKPAQVSLGILIALETAPNFLLFVIIIFIYLFICKNTFRVLDKKKKKKRKTSLSRLTQTDDEPCTESSSVFTAHGISSSSLLEPTLSFSSPSLLIIFLPSSPQVPPLCSFFSLSVRRD